MRILVYGAGVIGCYLAHVLCAAGNEVALLARGQWREVLERDGLAIAHHLQRKTTLDRPRIVGEPGEEPYDIVFAVMQYQQMGHILEGLARINAPLVVLVGNNIAAPEMERAVQAGRRASKTVLFGFQGTGGRREGGRAVCVRLGEGSMSLGGALAEAPAGARETVSAAFRGTGYRLTWVPNMDAWYKCHLALILPVCYLSYALGCDLTRARGRQVGQLMEAAREGYGFLRALGCQILPEGSLEDLEGAKGKLFQAMLWAMAKTSIGRLAASDHCRHAVGEMEALDGAFAALRGRRPEIPMPAWDALRGAMPDWEVLRARYGAGQ